MTAKLFEVQIVTASGLLWQGKVHTVSAVSELGGFAVMAGHEPLMAKLVDGAVFCKGNEPPEMVYMVVGGILRADQLGVTILCESATLANASS